MTDNIFREMLARGGYDVLKEDSTSNTDEPLFTYIVQTNKIKNKPKYEDASELWDVLCTFVFFWEHHNQVYSKEVMLCIGEIYKETKKLLEKE